ncbi:MAG TPA: adenylosuccinate synthetase [Longimicrobium sp.]
MPRRIVLLSGHVATGKSDVAAALDERFGVRLFKTREVIHQLKKVEPERGALQRAGEALDRETKGAWVATELRRFIDTMGPEGAESIVVVDAVRIRAQCDAVRRAYGSRVMHVHLTASKAVREERFGSREGEVQELASYDAVLENRTEQQADTLNDIADIVVNTERNTIADVVVRIASRIGLYGRGLDRTVDVLVGGQWGSEGKGNVVGYLAPEYDVLVRVGGPNAGHQVYQEPVPDTFYHLPSGTNRAPHTEIVLGPGATLEPVRLLEEINKAHLDPSRLRIDPHAMIIEPGDLAEEARRLTGSIGSTGQGVGAATARKVLRTGAKRKVRLAKDFPGLKPFLRPTLDVLDRAYAAGKRIFLEGTQGTGLSLHHGEYPYVTSRDTTVSGCLADAGIAPTRVRRIVMVSRSYPIRVQDPPGGTSGHMPIELDWKTVANRAGLDAAELKAREKTTTTKRDRRVAEFDWTLLRRAATLNGPTDIALSFTDHLDAANRAARRFDQLVPDTIQFVEEIERVAGAPVSLIVTRFDYRNIIDRRQW